MPQNFKHIKEFSKNAATYAEYNIIQKEVARHLLNGIKSKPKTILDLGAGSGAISSQIDWSYKKFVAVDRSQKMCELHPKGNDIVVICEDFDDESLFEKLGNFDLIIASSSLQWSSNLDLTLSFIAKHTKEVALAIFCDKTFKTIYKMSGKKLFLPNANQLSMTLDKYFDFKSELKEYRLEFEDNISKFRYIKKSGVSSGKRELGYKDTKKLIREYPLSYLEFEVLFVWGRSKVR